MASPNDLPKPDASPGEAPPRWRFRLIVALLVVVGAAVATRYARGSSEARAEETAANRSAAGGGMTTSLVPGERQPGTTPQTTPQPEEKDTLDTVLPYVSEGGIAMILGLLLGMVTRFFLKVALVFSILGFIAVQYLSHKGVVNVDWGAMKDFVLNMVPKGASATDLVQKKLPSLGAFGLGYLLGLKRG